MPDSVFRYIFGKLLFAAGALATIVPTAQADSVPLYSLTPVPLATGPYSSVLNDLGQVAGWIPDTRVAAIRCDTCLSL